MFVLLVLGQSVAILENGELVEMRARTFKGVRQWCLAYQEQWQVYNNLCLNEELSADYRKAAATGGEAIADYRDYPVQPAPGQNSETMPGSGGRAEILAVEDRNTRTHAAKYIYGVVCTGVLNYACRKILETSVVKPDSDTVAVPTSAEVDALLAKFDQQTPQVASAQAEAAEQLKEAPAAPAAGEQQNPDVDTLRPNWVTAVLPAAEGPAERSGESQNGAEVTGEPVEGNPAEGEEGPEVFGDQDTYPSAFPGDFEADDASAHQNTFGEGPAASPVPAVSKHEAAEVASTAVSQGAVTPAFQGNAAAAAPPPRSEQPATADAPAAPTK